MSKSKPLVTEELSADAIDAIEIATGGKLMLATPAGALWVQENDVNTRGDGGRVVLASSPVPREMEDMHLAGVTVVNSFRRDDPMNLFPVDREARDTRFFQVLVIEVKPKEG